MRVAERLARGVARACIDDDFRGIGHDEQRERVACAMRAGRSLHLGASRGRGGGGEDEAAADALAVFVAAESGWAKEAVAALSENAVPVAAQLGAWERARSEVEAGWRAAEQAADGVMLDKWLLYRENVARCDDDVAAWLGVAGVHAAVVEWTEVQGRVEGGCAGAELQYARRYIEARLVARASRAVVVPRAPMGLPVGE